MGTFRKIYFGAAFVAFVFLLVSLLPSGPHANGLQESLPAARWPLVRGLRKLAGF